jgi:Domain of Unknown Function (DUF1080)
MNIRKIGGGRIACMSIAVVVVAALAFLVYTPRAASQDGQAAPAGQAAQGAPPAAGAPGAQAGRGGPGGRGRAATPRDYNDEAGFLKLFNGDNLDGWTSDGQNWSVKDGSIYADSTCEHPTGTIYIYSDIGLAGDFDLKVRMKGTVAVNSGIQYRSWLAVDPDAPHFPRPNFAGRGGAGRGAAGRGPGGAGAQAGRGAAAGRGGAAGGGRGAGPCPNGQGTPLDRNMEAKYDMIGPQYDFDNGNNFPGQFYEQRGRGIVAFPGQIMIDNGGDQPRQLITTLADTDTIKSWLHKDDWNDEEVIAEGHTYLHFLNGHLASVFVDNNPTYFSKTGHIGFEIESIGEIYIKDIYLKKFN